jgi:hypothetical protein
MRDMTPTPLDPPSERQADGLPDVHEARPGTMRAIRTSSAARRKGWGLSRQARRRNARLMLLLLGSAPLSRQA